jgi:tetratricopeptide (TPR) repeat protein
LDQQDAARSSGRPELRIALGLVLAGFVAVPAWATETPRYEPAPSWVVPAPPIRQGASPPPLVAVLDEQTRIADGTVWTYREVGARAVSADALARLGALTLNWQPFHGDLIVHRVDIVRDGQHIDVLKAGQKFSVIRREQGLERLEMNGILTATLQVEGLRVGDYLDVAYSVTVKDPALKGGVQAGAIAVSEPFKVDFARARFMWPDGTPIRWKAHPVGLTAAESDKGGWHELSFALPAPKQPDMPADAPKRFQPFPAIEVSTFADWPAVSAVFAPLYRTDGLIAPGTPLAQEVARIRARETDPMRRAAAALSLVQDRVRYFAEGMNGGNYVPQSPDKTWSAGYGDCKAKTLLLLAMLHELGIDAESVLASIGQGDLVTTRLPAPAAFNHVLVHAKIGGEDLWLDGTGRGSRLEDMGDPPPFRSVLPVRASGASLVQLPSKAPARPTVTVSIDIDESAALGTAAPFTATAEIRGAAADALRAITAQLDNEKLLSLAFATLGGAAGSDAVPVTQKFAFDAAGGTATISVTGITKPGWRRQDHAYSLRPASGISSLTLSSDRSRPAWKDIPVATGDPGHIVVATRLHLPDGGRGIVLEGDATLDLAIGGRHFMRKGTLSGDLLAIEEEVTSSGEELPAADLPSDRAKLAAAKARVLRVKTGPGYPAPYQQIAAALGTHKLDKLAALYSARIAAKPDDADRYLSRAAFYEGTFQRNLALADLDKAISLDGGAATFLRRASLLEAMGQKDKAAADYQSALGIDPSSKPVLARLGVLEVDAGRKDAALATIEEHLANADEDKPDWLMIKAQLLARAADAEGALAAIDAAIAIKSANAALFNERCWIKGTLAVQLDSAVQDCTRAIELTEDSSAELDSRAMVYFRLNRLDDALADLNAALDRNPASSGSLYLRAVVERKIGKARDADVDAANARRLAPRIDEDYARWKIKA